MRILIVGGYGTFGGRIVELFAPRTGLTLIVSGRSLARAERYCAAQGKVAATLEPAVFDRDGDALTQIRALRPAIVVDASGPFQAYGRHAYRLVEACIEARVHYLDLADGSDFVAGIGVFNQRACAAKIYVLSGVSSFPVLTAAVVRRLARDMLRVDAIEGGIAPSPYAGVGDNVVRAIAAYAGQPVAYLGRTAKTVGRPFTQQRRYVVAPPGCLPLRSTMFSLVDVPDLRALSALWPESRRIWMGAGPVPEALHRVLIVCAWLVRIGVLRSLSPLASLMSWTINRLRWGEHRGGMYIEVRGAEANDKAITRSWHLLAEGADGPLIPSMAVEAVVLKHLAGSPPQIGARACLEEIELQDYEQLFAGRTIYTGERGPASQLAPLYERVLGEAWGRLPEQIRGMHAGTRDCSGAAEVERGDNALAWLAARMMGFPPSAKATPVRVRFDVDEHGETWTRTFGSSRFSSRQYEGRGRSAHLLCERFGALEFAMALVLEDGKLSLVPRRWKAFGVALPLWGLAPRTRAFEAVENDAFSFFVEISHPLCGLIVRYKGWLKPQPPGPRD